MYCFLILSNIRKQSSGYVIKGFCELFPKVFCELFPKGFCALFPKVLHKQAYGIFIAFLFTRSFARRGFRLGLFRRNWGGRRGGRSSRHIN